MPIDEDNSLTERPSKPSDLKNSGLEENGDSNISSNTGETVRDLEADISEGGEKLEVKVASQADNKMSIGDIDLESDNKSEGESVGDEKEQCGKSEGKENCDDIKPGKELSDSDIELEVKRTLREAVEIRVPKMKSQRDSKDQKWLASMNSQPKAHQEK